MRLHAWKAAVFSFIAAVAVVLAVFHMPAIMVAGAVADGLVFGWFRIAWIVVAAVFVYDVSVESGEFEVLKRSIGDISQDRRLPGPADRLRFRRRCSKAPAAAARPWPSPAP